MVDTSKFTYDTPVKIKILEPGYYLPEFSTYTPFESYASIEQVINIINRGITVDFPAQSEKREISNKVEDLILDYIEKQNELKKKYGNVGTNIEIALDTIQEINDSKTSIEEQIKEKNDHIFNNDDIVERIYKNLRNESIDRIFDSDEFIESDERIKKEAVERKSRERNNKRKKEALDQISMETDALRKLIQDAKFEFDSSAQRFDQIELLDQDDKDLLL